jgi:hypothetical protein
MRASSRHNLVRPAAFLAVLLFLLPGPAAAQSTDLLPSPALELTGGYAGFVDDATIDHGVIGGALRVHVTPRISVGPEIQYMIGPGEDRDVIVTGNLTFDVLPPGGAVTPFLVAGGGLFHHEDRFGDRTFASSEGAFTGGGGVRAWINDRVYVASELRLGWELHWRLTGTVGIALSR